MTNIYLVSLFGEFTTVYGRTPQRAMVSAAMRLARENRDFPLTEAGSQMVMGLRYLRRRCKPAYGPVCGAMATDDSVHGMRADTLLKRVRTHYNHARKVLFGMTRTYSAGLGSF